MQQPSPKASRPGVAIAFRSALAVLPVLCDPAALVAQASLGAVPVEPRWRQWLQGDALPHTGDGAAVCTVWAFYSQLPDLFEGDGGYLAGVRSRYAARGVEVVASVARVDPPGIDAWADCRVVLDDAVATERAWTVVNREVRANLLVTDRTGKIRFVGTPGAGLVDAIDAVLDGRDELAQEGRAEALRLLLPESFDEASAAQVLRPLLDAVAHAPRDGMLHGLLYLTRYDKELDTEGADRQLARALEVLADEPRPLAVFADLAMRGAPRAAGLLDSLRPPLERALEHTPRDPVVLRACLRVCVLAGDGRAAGRIAARARRHVTRSADDCLDFAMLLATDSEPLRWRDLAELSVARAEQLGADEDLVVAARYAVALRCCGDAERAGKLLDAHLGKLAAEQFNDEAWFLMTRLETMGRYDWFAAGICERMVVEEVPAHALDTAALAMFRVGRPVRALELQQAAVAADDQDRAYQRRLERYRAALRR